MNQPFFLFVVVSLTLFHRCFSAEQLVFPERKNVYIYELDIEWKLTMAHYRLDGLIRADVLKWDPSTQSYYVRHAKKNPATSPCNRFDPVLANTNLSDVIVYTGLHHKVMAINGKSPGDPIVVPYGAEVIMRVTNNLVSEGLTIHLHGMTKQDRWYTDGVSNVQQCPIAAGSTFDYRFIADSPGTLFYHGHEGVDRSQGLLGAFIVYHDDQSILLQNGNRITPSRQYIMMLQDWFLWDANDVWLAKLWHVDKFLYGYDDEDQCWTPRRTYDGAEVAGSFPVAGLLFNDKGWHNQTDIRTRPETLPLETYQVNPGENVLFRVIHGGTGPALMLSIEDHKLHIVAADGEPVQEIQCDMLIINPGERYDILLMGKSNPTKQSYHIIVESLDKFDVRYNDVEPLYGLARLEYNIVSFGQRSSLPDLKHMACQRQPNGCLVLNCPWKQGPVNFPYWCLSANDLKSTQSFQGNEALQPDYSRATNFEEYFINMHFSRNINGWMFKRPKAPPYFYPTNELAVVKPCTPEACRTSRLCPCFLHFNFTLGNIVQLTVYNMGKDDGGGYGHPLHIHGMHFFVVKMAYGTANQTTGMRLGNNPDILCDAEAACIEMPWANRNWMRGAVPGMNLENPTLRDTISIPRGGYVVLRFKADNPGWFYGHCHSLTHHMAGMAFAIRIGSHAQMPVPPPDFPRGCGIFEPSMVHL